MPRVDVVVETPVSRSIRARQVEAAFDVPPREKQKQEWHGDLDLSGDWRVGLIVGPSGSGKTTIARSLFGDQLDTPLAWGEPSVIDDFDKAHTVEEITRVCQAVGFNTIPAWLRPYAVLSNGEQFRVGLARRLLEGDDLIVVDEFTSVVDRQVAQIGAHAAQKFIRRHPTKRFIAVTCHYDVIDWLQPDWLLEPHTMAVQRREVQRRPELEVEIVRCTRAVWRVFAPFHYLTADVHRNAKFYCLLVAGRLASVAAIIPRPHPKRKNLWGVARLVTLPDWQGLGLAFVLVDRVAAMFKSMGHALRCYPAHPALVRAYDRSKVWARKKVAGQMNSLSMTKTRGYVDHARPCGVYEWSGAAHTPRSEASNVLHDIVPFNPRRWVK